MASFLERSKDADLDQLVRELASRTRGNRRRSLRLLAWKLTVKASYATKRMMDIVLSAVGMLLLSPVYLAIAAASRTPKRNPKNVFALFSTGRRKIASSSSVRSQSTMSAPMTISPAIEPRFTTR